VTAISAYGAWQVVLACGVILVCMWAVARLLDRWDP
jgi:hypothetical protein